MGMLYLYLILLVVLHFCVSSGLLKSGCSRPSLVKNVFLVQCNIDLIRFTESDGKSAECNK